MDEAARQRARRQREELLATVSPVSGVTSLLFVFMPPAVAVLGLVLAAIGFGCGWQVRHVFRARIGVALCAIGALLLIPGIVGPGLLAGALGRVDRLERDDRGEPAARQRAVSGCSRRS